MGILPNHYHFEGMSLPTPPFITLFCFSNNNQQQSTTTPVNRGSWWVFLQIQRLHEWLIKIQIIADLDFDHFDEEEKYLKCLQGSNVVDTKITLNTGWSSTIETHHLVWRCNNFIKKTQLKSSRVKQCRGQSCAQNMQLIMLIMLMLVSLTETWSWPSPPHHSGHICESVPR